LYIAVNGTAGNYEDGETKAVLIVLITFLINGDSDDTDADNNNSDDTDADNNNGDHSTQVSRWYSAPALSANLYRAGLMLTARLKKDLTSSVVLQTVAQAAAKKAAEALHYHENQRQQILKDINSALNQTGSGHYGGAMHTMTPATCGGHVFANKNEGWFVPEWQVYLLLLPKPISVIDLKSEHCTPQADIIFPLIPCLPTLGGGQDFLAQHNLFKQPRYFVGDIVTHTDSSGGRSLAVVTNYDWNASGAPYTLWKLHVGDDNSDTRLIGRVSADAIMRDPATEGDSEILQNVYHAFHSGIPSFTKGSVTYRVGGTYRPDTRAADTDVGIATIVSIEPDYANSLLPAKTISYINPRANGIDAQQNQAVATLPVANFANQFARVLDAHNYRDDARSRVHTAIEQERIEAAQAALTIGRMFGHEDAPRYMQHSILIVDIIGDEAAIKLMHYARTIIVKLSTALATIVQKLTHASEQVQSALVNALPSVDHFFGPGLKAAGSVFGLAYAMQRANIDILGYVPLLETFLTLVQGTTGPFGTLLGALKDQAAGTLARNMVGLGAMYFVKTYMSGLIDEMRTWVTNVIAKAAEQLAGSAIGVLPESYVPPKTIVTDDTVSMKDHINVAFYKMSGDLQHAYRWMTSADDVFRDSSSSYIASTLMSWYNGLNKEITRLESDLAKLHAAGNDSQWKRAILEPLMTLQTMLNTAGNTFFMAVLDSLKIAGIDIKIGSSTTQFSLFDTATASVLGVQADSTRVAHIKAVGAWGDVLTMLCGSWVFALQPLLEAGLPPLLDATGVSPVVLCRLVRNIPTFRNDWLRNLVRFLLIGSAMYNLTGAGTAQHYLQYVMPRALIRRFQDALDAFKTTANVLHEHIHTFLKACTDRMPLLSNQEPITRSTASLLQEQTALESDRNRAVMVEIAARRAYETAQNNGTNVTARYHELQIAMDTAYKLGKRCKVQQARCAEAAARDQRSGWTLPHAVMVLSHKLKKAVGRIMQSCSEYRFIIDFGAHLLDGSDINTSYWAATRQKMDLNRRIEFATTVTSAGIGAGLAAYAECVILDGIRALLRKYGAPARRLLEQLGKITLQGVLDTFKVPINAAVSISMGWMISIAIPAVTTAVTTALSTTTAVTTALSTGPLLFAAWVASVGMGIEIAARTQEKSWAVLKHLVDAQDNTGKPMPAFDIFPYAIDRKQLGSNARLLFDMWCTEWPCSAAAGAAAATANTTLFRDDLVSGAPRVRVAMGHVTTNTNLDSLFAELQYRLSADSGTPIAITQFSQDSSNSVLRRCTASMPLRRRFGSTVSVGVKITSPATAAAKQRRHGMGTAYAELLTSAETPDWALSLGTAAVPPAAWVGRDLGHRTAARRRYLHGASGIVAATNLECQLLVILLMHEARHIHAHATTTERAAVPVVTDAALQQAKQKAIHTALTPELERTLAVAHSTTETKQKGIHMAMTPELERKIAVAQQKMLSDPRTAKTKQNAAPTGGANTLHQSALANLMAVYTDRRYGPLPWAITFADTPAFWQLAEGAIVYYDADYTKAEASVLARQREPVNIAMERSQYYSQQKMQDYFGWKTGVYKGPAESPNIAIYCRTPFKYPQAAVAKHATIHCLNVIAYGFDNARQPDYKYFVSNDNKAELPNKLLAIFAKIFRCAGEHKLKTVVLCGFGLGAFSQLFPGKMAEEYYLPALEAAFEANLHGSIARIEYFAGGDNDHVLKKILRLCGKYKLEGGRHPFLALDTTMDSAKLYVNAWDPWSLVGNGHAGDDSLDGYFGRSTAMALLCWPVTNPSLQFVAVGNDGMT